MARRFKFPKVKVSSGITTEMAIESIVAALTLCVFGIVTSIYVERNNDPRLYPGDSGLYTAGVQQLTCGSRDVRNRVWHEHTLELEVKTFVICRNGELILKPLPSTQA